jgi:hypothetical protein
MSDYLAYLTAQREVRDLTTSALPDAPTLPHPAVPATGPLRRRAARMLVRAARRLEPDAAAHQT